VTGATVNGAFPHDARAAAGLYLERGLSPIPLPAGSKAPDLAGWRDLRLTPGTLELHFPAERAGNVGVLMGSASDRLIDVDLDSQEAVAVADLLLAPTSWVFGRPSRPRSHRLYRPTGAPARTRQFAAPGGEMLLELRADGCQTMFPPSLHPCGEQVAWDCFDSPGDCPTADLMAAVAEVAAAALLARHWPDRGSRDRAAMALTGGLARASWPDERVSRFVLAVATAAGDEEARMRAGKAAPTARKQGDGRETTGWPTLARLLRGDGEAVVRQVREWLGMRAKAAPAEPITPDPPPWPEPPGEEAFYGLAGRIVRAIEPSTEADTAALLVQALVAFGSMAGRHAHFRVEASRHFTNEFAVLVGKTSKSRKGTSWERVYRLLEQADAQWCNEQVASGVSSGEGVLWTIRDAIHKRERIKEQGQVRYEEVEADPGVTDKRLLLFEPEFANVLKQTERQGNTASVILRQAWDGTRVLRTLTKNSPARVTEGHISMIGHITQEELTRYLTQTETANGFANRFLFVCADRSKLLPDGGVVEPEALDGLRAELVEALGFAKASGELRRDEEARELWHQVYGQLSEGKPGLAGFLLARAEAHVMRVALLYALLDRSAEIRAAHLLAALALWDYCDRSVRAVFGDSLGDPVADELLRLLRGCPNGLTRTDIRDYFQRNASADRIGRALGLLLQHRLARREEEQTGGRPSERWHATSARRG
jgi:hypothetical protein